MAVLLAATSATYGAAIGLNGLPPGRGRTAVFAITSAALAGYLVFFKIVPLTIVAIGVSYYTFKLLSCLIDVHWAIRAPERDFPAFLSHLVFFPQIVAGPIQRSEDCLT